MLQIFAVLFLQKNIFKETLEHILMLTVSPKLGEIGQAIIIALSLYQGTIWSESFHSWILSNFGIRSWLLLTRKHTKQ